MRSLFCVCAGSLALFSFAYADVEPTGKILYCGATQGGWQIFEGDLQTGLSTQLTKTLGDKRSPGYVRSRDWVTFKDSQGTVGYLENGSVVYPFEHERSIGDYAFSVNGDRCYFTRLATNNPQRQFLWSISLDSDKGPQLVLRMDQGSLRQVQMSPNGKYLVATHIWRVGEERVVIIPTDFPDNYFYLSPEGEEAFSPSWSPNSEAVLFSMRTPDGTFDIYEGVVSNGQLRKLLETKGMSEWYPSLDPAGQWVLFETAEAGGSEIGYADVDRGIPSHLGIKGKEPVWRYSSGGVVQ